MKRTTTKSEAMRERAFERERVHVRERDQKDLLAQHLRIEARVAEAVVTVLHRADPRTLAAFGVLLEFVAQRRTGRPR